MQTAAEVRPQSDIRESPRSRSVAAAKETLHFLLELRHRGIHRFPPWIDDNGPLWAQLFQMQADGLSDAPPDAVSHHGFADGAGQGETNTRALRLRFPKAKGCKQRANIAAARVVNSSEIPRTQQSDTFRKT
jgi:hypothetical protein